MWPCPLQRTSSSMSGASMTCLRDKQSDRQFGNEGGECLLELVFHRFAASGIQARIERHLLGRSPEVHFVLAPREKQEFAPRVVASEIEGAERHRQRAVVALLDGADLEVAADVGRGV